MPNEYRPITSLTDIEINAMPRGEAHKQVLKMLRAINRVQSKQGWTLEQVKQAVKESNGQKPII